MKDTVTILLSDITDFKGKKNYQRERDDVEGIKVWQSYLFNNVSIYKAKIDRTKNRKLEIIVEDFKRF